MLSILFATNVFSTENPTSQDSTNTEDFYTKYNQPKEAQGSPDDFKQFWETGECRYCNLQDFDLREAIKKHKNKERISGIPRLGRRIV